jgi:hypothetical protein
MKRIRSKAFILLTTMIIAACGSDGSDDSAVNSNPINLAGTWDYLISTQNSICDGVYAQGKMTINTTPGDSTMMGTIVITGDEYELSTYGNCYVVTSTYTETDWVGRPIAMTAAEYLNFVQQDNYGDSTIASTQVTAFTNDRIVEVVTYTNSVIITSTISR